MHRVTHLKQDHEEIFRSLLEFEEIIDKRHDDLDNSELVYIFNKVMGLVVDHEKKRKLLLKEIEGDYYLKIPVDRISLDPRRISGYIRVINEAILSENPDNIGVALDNDGRMFISKIKEHIFREEMVLDRLLFLHIVSR